MDSGAAPPPSSLADPVAGTGPAVRRPRASQTLARGASVPRREAPEDPSQLVARFVRLLEGEGRSPWTVKQYAFTARHFLQFVGKPLEEVRPEDLERWREHLVLSRHYAKASVYGSLRAVACLLRSFGSGAAEGVEVPRRPSQLPNFLNEEEAHRLLAAAEGSPRDKAILRVLAYGGLRVGELCRLTVDDLDLDHQLLRVRAGKGEKDRMVVVEATTCEAVRAWLAERGTEVGDLRVFPLCRESVERLVRARAEAAGITKEVTPHTLRHTLATTLLRRGLDLRFIQKQLGHASVATTQIYTHVDTEALQVAYRKAEPEY